MTRGAEVAQAVGLNLTRVANLKRTAAVKDPIDCSPEDPAIPTILTFVDYYLPAYKAGGPLRALSNLVEAVGDLVDFRIVTQDRDRDDTRPFEGIPLNSWQKVGGANVMYVPLAELTSSRIRNLIRDTPHNAIFINSMFSPVTRRILLLRKRGKLPGERIVLSPRGEAAPTALSIKPWRKRAYLLFARIAGLYDDLLWLSSSPHETSHIRAIAHRLGASPDIEEIPELPASFSAVTGERAAKVPGSLKVAFLGRIVPVKNLVGAIGSLAGVEGKVSFTIFGPREDERYWRECEREIARLGENVTVTAAGPIPHEQVARTLAAYDLLLAPSFGENYGHAIIEALSAGCPVVTSDATPWRGLEPANAGWDLPATDIQRMRSAIQKVVNMDESQHAMLRKCAVEYSRMKTHYTDIIQKNLALFDSLGGARAKGVA